MNSDGTWTTNRSEYFVGFLMVNIFSLRPQCSVFFLLRDPNFFFESIQLVFNRFFYLLFPQQTISEWWQNENEFPAMFATQLVTFFCHCLDFKMLTHSQNWSIFLFTCRVTTRTQQNGKCCRTCTVKSEPSTDCWSLWKNFNLVYHQPNSLERKSTWCLRACVSGCERGRNRERTEIVHQTWMRFHCYSSVLPKGDAVFHRLVLSIV